jgi:hypothetical protein
MIKERKRIACQSATIYTKIAENRGVIKMK